MKKETIHDVQDFFEQASRYMCDGDRLEVEECERQEVGEFLQYFIFNSCDDLMYVYNEHDGLMTEREYDMLRLRMYVEQNVKDYDVRYGLALERVDEMRITLAQADECLWRDIERTAEEFCDDNNIVTEHIDLPEIFG